MGSKRSLILPSLVPLRRQIVAQRDVVGGHGGDGLAVELAGLSGLFQP